VKHTDILIIAASATCQAYNFSTVLENKFNNIHNNVSGGSTENGTKNTILNGQQDIN
jgi:hypothetical protein